MGIGVGRGGAAPSRSDGAGVAAGAVAQPASENRATSTSSAPCDRICRKKLLRSMIGYIILRFRGLDTPAVTAYTHRNTVALECSVTIHHLGKIGRPALKRYPMTSPDPAAG